MIDETSTANRNDTSSSPCCSFFYKDHDTVKLDTSHRIFIPSSDTHNHKPYQPYNTIHSSSYLHLLNKNTARSLQMHRNNSYSYTTSLSNPAKAKLRARLIETFKDSQQKFKNMDTHKKKRV